MITIEKKVQVFWSYQYEGREIEDDAAFESENDARDYIENELIKRSYPGDDNFEMVRFIEFKYNENDDMQIISRTKWENENELFN